MVSVTVLHGFCTHCRLWVKPQLTACVAANVQFVTVQCASANFQSVILQSVIFHSCNFHPCNFVRIFPVQQCPVLQMQQSRYGPHVWSVRQCYVISIDRATLRSSWLPLPSFRGRRPSSLHVKTPTVTHRALCVCVWVFYIHRDSQNMFFINTVTVSQQRSLSYFGIKYAKLFNKVSFNAQKNMSFSRRIVVSKIDFADAAVIFKLCTITLIYSSVLLHFNVIYHLWWIKLIITVSLQPLRAYAPPTFVGLAAWYTLPTFTGSVHR